jgi:PAS domain S-box-containing protein
LANAVPQLVWVADPNGEVLYYNDRVSEFAGAKKNVDGKWRSEGLVHEDDSIATQIAWKEAVEKGTDYQIEHRIRMKDGNIRWFLSRAFPYRDEQGTVIKWFGTATDIHASKMNAAILEEEVKKRTKELNETNLSLLQSNNELQQFAHVASHDLKEPVRKIKTFTNRLMEDSGSAFSDTGKLYIGKVNSAADRMNIMIEGVLNYSMLSAAHQRIEEVDLNETLKNIEADLEVIISQKQASVQYRNLPTVEGASVLLYQLFYNLVNNSLKFSRPDECSVITILSSLTKKDEKEWVEITINDNGIGFEQEFAEKIFETFLRLNSKDQFEGTGLGLSLCKRIIERHGGTIKAFGEPDKGASFVISLPLKQEKRNI